MSRSLITIAAITAVGGLAAYAIYFDNKRRTDPAFRRKLQKQQRQVSRASSKASTSAGPMPGTQIMPDDLRAALQVVRGEEVPASPDAKEQYFMQHVSIGEQLSVQGPAFHLPAALSFYRALRVYPAPVELIMIYEKTVPEPIFKIIMDLTSLDVSPSSAPSSAKGGAKSEATITKVEEENDNASPTRGGPPSETGSHDWETLSNPQNAPSTA